jgi:capsular polysaccharide biosynthesis protein
VNIYTKILKKYWHLFLLLVVLITASSFGVSAVQEPEYKSEVKLLVIQNQGQRLDAYTAARSAQTVGEVITKMVYTSSFFDKVLTSKYEIKDDFGSDLEKRREKWEDRVKVRLSDETGSVQISVYHEDRKQAEQIAFGIAHTIINYGENYHGGGSQIEIKMVDLPITSEKTVRPNILLNTVAGFSLGILLSLVIVVLISSKKEEKNESYKISDKF